MFGLKYAAVLAMGLTLSACAGTLAGFSSISGQEVYASPGYYSPTFYPAYRPYAEPGYVIPYTYQPGYGGSYGYAPGWRGGRDGWREHEEHERRERAFEHDGGRPYGQPRQDPGNVPHMAVLPRSLGPAAPPRMAPQPPPVARLQVDQNRKLLDQLGFRPSR